VLEGLAPFHEFPRLLLDWRALTKLKSTYVDALPEAMDADDQRVHTTFDQAGAATGRLASLDPNLQNIPIRTPQGRAIRRAFVAAPGCVLVGADYSQIELRVLAHLSEDPSLLEAFHGGEDIHAATARRIFTVTGDVAPELRARAKTVNFGVLYGMGARSLAQQMGLELKDAKEFIDGYFTVYAGVRRYDRTSEAPARLGRDAARPPPLPELRSTTGRSFAERAAINTPIQARPPPGEAGDAERAPRAGEQPGRGGCCAGPGNYWSSALGATRMRSRHGASRDAGLYRCASAHGVGGPRGTWFDVC
jgi:DNA polymerase-1